MRQSSESMNPHVCALQSLGEIETLCYQNKCGSGNELVIDEIRNNASSNFRSALVKQNSWESESVTVAPLAHSHSPQTHTHL